MTHLQRPLASMPDTDPRKVPVQRRARETVRAMLDATAHILTSGEPLTTNRIAEVAGVSIGSLYQYFPTKEALVAALVERMLADDLAWLAGTLDDGPLRPQLARVLSEGCLRQASHAPLMARVLPLLPVVERDEVARRAFDEMARWLSDRLEQEDGLRPALADPRRRAQAVFVVTRSLRWSLNEATMAHPEWLLDPGFQAELVHLFQSLWAPPSDIP